MITKLVGSKKEGVSIYDPALGTASLLLGINQDALKENRYYGQDISTQAIKTAIMNAIVNDVDDDKFEFKNENTLANNWEFGKVDIVVSDPPINMKWNVDRNLSQDRRYRDYELSVEGYQQFHLPRIEELVNAEVDILAIETQPKLDEVLAILELLKKKYPQQKVYVSYTLSDDDTISDGTPLPRAIHALEDYSQVIAAGINCVKLELVEPALKNMKEITDKHLIVYPNSSAVYDPKSKTWSQPKTSATFEELIPNWYEAGARIIGGCCTTGPKEIKAVADFIKRNK